MWRFLLNTQNKKDGDTALMWAVWTKNIEITATLIDAGANVNLQSNYGEQH